MRQDEEKKKDHRLIRVTPSIQMLEIPEGARHTEGKNRLRGLRVQDLDPCEWGETHSLQTLRLGSHIHSLQGKPPSPDPAPGVHNPWLGHQVSAGWAPRRKQVGSCNFLGW